MSPSSFVCGGRGSAPSDVLRQLVGLGFCCEGATESPADCTCWEPEYDQEQAAPVEAEPGTRSTMCDDCAYRPTSPERTGDPSYVSDFDTFAAGIFYCHQGMRKPVRWRHPGLGITVEATGDYYAPPMRLDAHDEPVPYKADGTPGDRCAGWAAHRRADAQSVGVVLGDAGEELERLG